MNTQLISPEDVERIRQSLIDAERYEDVMKFDKYKASQVRLAKEFGCEVKEKQPKTRISTPQTNKQIELNKQGTHYARTLLSMDDSFIKLLESVVGSMPTSEFCKIIGDYRRGKDILLDFFHNKMWNL